MKILIIDNYDSFTYNLLHAVQKLGYSSVEVVRNDKFEMDYVAQFDKIILSPGPGIPSEAGGLLPLLERYGATKSILGVCLGHQAIGECYGAELENLSDVYHGVQSTITLTAAHPLFEGVEAPLAVGRYHSWVVRPESLPPSLEVLALSEEGQIMAMRHREYDICSVQFHPESVLTPQGERIISNFLKL